MNNKVSFPINQKKNRGYIYIYINPDLILIITYVFIFHFSSFSSIAKNEVFLFGWRLILPLVCYLLYLHCFFLPWMFYLCLFNCPSISYKHMQVSPILNTCKQAAHHIHQKWLNYALKIAHKCWCLRTNEIYFLPTPYVHC